MMLASSEGNLRGLQADGNNVWGLRVDATGSNAGCLILYEMVLSTTGCNNTMEQCQALVSPDFSSATVDCTYNITNQAWYMEAVRARTHWTCEYGDRVPSDGLSTPYIAEWTQPYTHTWPATATAASWSESVFGAVSSVTATDCSGDACTKYIAVTQLSATTIARMINLKWPRVGDAQAMIEKGQINVISLPPAHYTAAERAAFTPTVIATTATTPVNALITSTEVSNTTVGRANLEAKAALGFSDDVVTQWAYRSENVKVHGVIKMQTQDINYATGSLNRCAPRVAVVSAIAYNEIYTTLGDHMVTNQIICICLLVAVMIGFGVPICYFLSDMQKCTATFSTMPCMAPAEGRKSQNMAKNGEVITRKSIRQSLRQSHNMANIDTRTSTAAGIPGGGMRKSMRKSMRQSRKLNSSKSGVGSGSGSGRAPMVGQIPAVAAFNRAPSFAVVGSTGKKDRYKKDRYKKPLETYLEEVEEMEEVQEVKPVEEDDEELNWDEPMDGMDDFLEEEEDDFDPDVDGLAVEAETSRALHKRLNHQVHLCNIYCALILVCLVLLWVFWTIEVDMFTEESATIYVNLLHVRTSQTVAASLSKNLKVTNLLHEAYVQGYVDLTNSSNPYEAESMMIRTSCVFPDIPFVFVGMEATGNFIGAYNCSTIAIRDSRTNNRLIEYGVTSDFKANMSHVMHDDGDYDARVRPWFNQGRDVSYLDGGAGDVHTTKGINANAAATSLVVPFIKPAKAADGAFVAVFATDMTLDTVSQDIRNNELWMGDNGRFFIVDYDNNLVGTSHPAGIHLTEDRAALEAADSIVASESLSILSEFKTFVKAWGTMDIVAKTMKYIDTAGHNEYVYMPGSWTQVILIERKALFADLYMSANFTFVIVIFSFCVSFQLCEAAKSHIDSKRGEEANEIMVTGDDEKMDEPTKQEAERHTAIKKLVDRHVSKKMGWLQTVELTAFEKRQVGVKGGVIELQSTLSSEEAAEAKEATWSEAVKFLHEANSRYHVVGTLYLEETYGSESQWLWYHNMWQSKAYKHYQSLTAIMYVILEAWNYAYDSSEWTGWCDTGTPMAQRSYHCTGYFQWRVFYSLELLCMAGFVLDAVFRWVFEVREEEARQGKGSKEMVAKGTIVHCSTVLVGAIAVMIKGVADYPYMISYTRFWVIIFRSTGRRHAAALLVKSLWAAADVFILMFFLAGFCAVISILLYSSVLTGDTNTENFQDAIIAMFVFVTTGENYTNVSEPVLKLSRVYFVFLVGAVIMGIFFVMSMVIAIFEQQYNTDKDDIKYARAKRETEGMQVVYHMCKELGNPFEDNGEESSGISRESFMYLMWKYTETYDWRKLLKTSISIKALDRKYKSIKDLSKINNLHQSSDAEVAENLEHIENERRTLLMELFAKVFMLLDSDGDEYLQWEEFREVFSLLRIVMVMEGNSLIYSLLDLYCVRLRYNKDQAMLEDVRARQLALASLKHHTDITSKAIKEIASEEHLSLGDTVDTEQLVLTLRKRRIKLQEKEEVYQEKLGLSQSADRFFGLQESVLNNFVAVIVLFHFTLLAATGTYDTTRTEWRIAFEVADLVFHSFYFVELACKIQQSGTTNIEQDLHELDDTDRAQKLKKGDQTGLTPRSNAQLDQIKAAAHNDRSCLGIFFHGYYTYRHHPYSVRRSVTRSIDLYIVMIGGGAAIAWAVLCWGLGFSPRSSVLIHIKTLMAFSIVRLVTLMEGLNRIVFSLVSGLDISNYIFLLIMVIQMFGTFGQQCFGTIAPEYFEPDNFTAYVTLFQLLLGEGWHEVMYAVANKTVWMSAWYFIAYIFLVTILFTQLFVGFIIEKFSEIQTQLSKEHNKHDDPFSEEMLQCKTFGILQDIDDVDEEEEEKMLVFMERLWKLETVRANDIVQSYVAGWKTKELSTLSTYTVRVSDVGAKLWAHKVKTSLRRINMMRFGGLNMKFPDKVGRVKVTKGVELVVRLHRDAKPQEALLRTIKRSEFYKTKLGDGINVENLWRMQLRVDVQSRGKHDKKAKRHAVLDQEDTILDSMMTLTESGVEDGDTLFVEMLSEEDAHARHDRDSRRSLGMRDSTKDFEKTLEDLSPDLKKEPWEEWEGFEGRKRYSTGRDNDSEDSELDADDFDI